MSFVYEISINLYLSFTYYLSIIYGGFNWAKVFRRGGLSFVLHLRRKLHATLIDVLLSFSLTISLEDTQPRDESTSGIIDIARAVCKKVSPDTYQYAETCPGHRAAAQGRVRIDTTANVRAGGAFVCFKPVASLPCLEHVNARGDKAKRTCAMRAWHAVHIGGVAFHELHTKKKARM